MFCCILFTIIYIGCGNTNNFPVLSGPYLGQDPPGMTPELFAPDVFSMGIHTFSTAFTPCGNEIYFSRFEPAKKIDKIMFTRKVNNTWTKPETVPFSGIHSENDVRITSDGFRMFFRSGRQLPDFTKNEKHLYIWYTHRNSDGTWSEKEPLKCGGAYLRTGDIGISNNGTLYFAHIRDKVNSVYKSRLVDGEYGSPEFVITMPGYPESIGDTFVAPDESYLIVSCWDLPENKGESDLYISFRMKNGDWTPLENMGAPVNTEDNENCATLSPDGKYLFYLSVGDIGQTYWIDAKIIEKFRPEHIK